MLINYLKIAIAVLKRRKFFTFISLFGISFTLTILLVLSAFITRVVGDDYPDRKRERLLYINTIEEKGKNSQSSGPMSFYFLNHYAGSLKTPEKVAISSLFEGTNTYVNNKKITVNYKYTNSEFWDVLDFDFLEGKSFNKQQVSNGEKVAVISEEIKKKYFGDSQTAVGKYIEADNEKYRVSGVVKSVPITMYMIYSDIYLPYSVSKSDYNKITFRGSYTAILMAASKEEVPAMQQEYEQMISRIPMISKDYDKIFSHADTFITGYLRTGREEISGVTYASMAIAIFVLFVMLLPTLNLVNINITRIMERSSEIGVRKAFGASSRTLALQFIIENIILTFLGGFLGVVLSLIIIQVFNSMNLIPNLELSMNFTVLFIGIITCFAFGFLSGVYPAWRMSRMNVVNALKT